MRKTVSALVAIAILLSVLSTVCAETPDAYFLLRAQNFQTEGWTKQELTQSDINRGSLPSGFAMYISRATGEEKAKARVYISSEGEYTIFSLGRDTEDASYGKRGFVLYTDNQEINYRFGNINSRAVAGWSWDTAAPKITLSKGWHDFEIKNPDSYVRICALLITNDADLSVSDISNAYEDTVPPNVTDFSTTDIQENSVALSWNGQAREYQIYRNNEVICTLNGGESSYTDTGLAEGTYYEYKLSAADDFNNQTEKTIRIKTGGEEDTELPRWDAGSLISAEISAVTARLSWPEAEDNRGVLGYKVYIGEEVCATVNSVEYTITNVLPGTTLEVKITAWDANDNESMPLSKIISFPTADALLLREQNFKGSWQRVKTFDYSDKDIIPAPEGMDNSYLYGNGAEGNIAARIYIEKAENYTLWVMDKNVPSESYTVSVDGKALEIENVSRPGWSWNKGSSTWLEIGWHKVDISAKANDVRIAATALIEKDSFDITEVTDYDKVLSLYQDVAAPVFQRGLTFEYAGDLVKATWGAAGDAIVQYRIKAGKDTYYTVETYCVLSGQNMTDTLQVEVEAADRYGNTATLKDSTVISPIRLTKLKIDVQVGKASVTAQYTKMNGFDGAVIVWIGVYDLDSGRMVSGGEVRDTGGSCTAEAVLPPDYRNTKYAVKAGIWDAGDKLTPFVRAAFGN